MSERCSVIADSARTLLLTTLCLVAAATLVGCCASWQSWAATERELRKENRARAEPAMRAAARRVGATLLPIRPSELPSQGVCESVIVPEIGPDKGCALWQAEDGSAFRFLDARGKVRLAVPVRSPSWPYARLARHGGDLFLLVPEVSRQKAGEATRCECDGMPGPSWDRLFGFMLEDVRVVRVEVVSVPMVEEYIDWTCKVTLM